MRRLPTGTDHPGRPRRRFQTVSAALALAATALGLALQASPARAQAAKKAAAAPTPLDPRPLARFVPRDNLVCFVEVQGFDLQADAWKKTAAYKMLNDTPLGEMLEAMAVQLGDKALSFSPNRKTSGADLVAVAKHAIKSGFVFGINPQAEDAAYGTFVVRNGTAKEVRATFSRMLGQLMGASKPQVVKKAGRSMILLPMADQKDTWAWWAEQNDLVIVLGKGTEEVVAATIDGSRPNASENPIRSELVKAEGGFAPAASMFIDPKAIPAGNKPGGPSRFFDQVTKLGMNRVDYRWGFQDDALMSVWRVKAPKPRKGLLALLDQPTLDKTKLPPLPEGIQSFTVMALDPAKLFDAVVAAVPQPQRDQITSALDSVKSKSRIDVRKDVLTHLGPKLAFYTLPGAPARPAGEAAAGKESPTSPPTTGGPLGGILAGIPGLGGAAGAIPKYTLVIEVDDATAFGKTLDNLMVAVNRELKTQSAARADAAEAAADAAGGTVGRTRGPGGPGGGGALADEGGGGSGRGRRAGGGSGGSGPVAAPEFKLMPGKDKIYQLNVPPSLARQFPAGLRPTVRLGAKHVVIAVAPDAARAALEVKPGEWSVPADVAPAFDQLPTNLTFLSVSDPRGTTPELLASLPANLQRGVNTALTLAQSGAKPGTPGGPDTPNAAAAGGPTAGLAVAGGPSGASSGGARTSSGYPASGGAPSGYPGGPGGGGAPGGGGGEANAESNAGGGLLQFNIDPAKLPKPSDLREKMFPASFAIVIDDQEVRFVNRESFPNLITPASGMGIALVLPAVQAARQAAMRAAGAAGGPGQVPGTPPPTGVVPGAVPPAGGESTPAPGGRGPRRGGPTGTERPRVKE